MIDRYYMIFDDIEKDIIDYSEVLETSALTLRFSLDGKKSFIKWEGTTPPSVNSLVTKDGPYTHAEIKVILDNSDWSDSPL